MIADTHLASRNMLAAIERTDGIEQPVLVPGNPVKLSKVDEQPDGRVPWVGEHTADVLRHELRLSEDEIAALAEAGVIGRASSLGP